MILRAREFEFRFPRPTIVMGVVNVTPDSFYDGGRFFDKDSAVARAIELEKQGAEILDIGGESSRPGAEPVSATEELRRVLPVIEALVERVKVPISIDTMKPAVARAALRAGASIVNDVAANRFDPEMWHVVAEYGAGYVCVHMQGTPQTMHLNPQYGDVISEIMGFFEDRMERLGKAGVKPEAVVLDPGLGFGKTVEHNLRLLAGLGQFKKFGRPLLVGASRKSFIGRVLGLEPQDRLSGSLACASWAVAAGASIIRTHDVAETAQAVRMTEAIMAQSG
ncbi:MAG: dihydropteroate synthase [Verrucomicrobiae bacterium]|nr:dihydropteroate synthase [Verrucomicrobiae bacterium]MDW7979114.1 dihydropteroate synthase [Verrucomicrobiales bacterium]